MIEATQRTRQTNGGAVTRPRRLAYVLQAVNAWGHRPIRYGESDCCMFAAHVLHYLTGRDFAKRLTWNSKREADDLIRRLGGLSGALTTVLEREPGSKVFLRPGDPVLLRRPGVEAICIYLGTDHVIGLDLQGRPQRFPLRWCPYGWAV